MECVQEGYTEFKRLSGLAFLLPLPDAQSSATVYDRPFVASSRRPRPAEGFVLKDNFQLAQNKKTLT